jgi:hypothetical protein
LYIGIIWGVQKGQQSHLQKGKVVLSKLIHEEIIKKILYSLKKIKNKNRNYMCLLKRNIVSIRATGFIIATKRNGNKKFRKDVALDHI